MFNERAKATYIGMTNNIERRVMEHKMGLVKGNTKDKGINKLAYYEFHQYADKAIAREKNMKKWKRVWKFDFIERKNPNWVDLAEYMDDYIKRIPKIEDMPPEAFRFIDPALPSQG